LIALLTTALREINSPSILSSENWHALEAWKLTLFLLPLSLSHPPALLFISPSFQIALFFVLSLSAFHMHTHDISHSLSLTHSSSLSLSLSHSSLFLFVVFFCEPSFMLLIHRHGDGHGLWRRRYLWKKCAFAFRVSTKFSFHQILWSLICSFAFDFALALLADGNRTRDKKR